MRFSSILALFISIFILSSCQREPEAGVESHNRMIALLDSLGRNGNPIDNYQLNAQRAQYLKDRLGELKDPNQLSMARFQMATEMLNAGQTKEAAAEFTALVRENQRKPLYDMLAVSYLRMGEIQNCVETHTSASCIVPLAQEGWHKLPYGSENAIKIYENILRAYPNDIQSRYLLNIAYMTLGRYPDGVPADYRMPMTAFESPNPQFPQFKDAAIPLGLDLSGLSGGVSMEDFNNDGFLDLFVTSYGMLDPVRLFFAAGDGSFSEVTETANLTGIVGGLNVLHADYNNDGWVDILILRGGWLDKGGNLPNSLLRNNGNGTFTDVTIDAGLLSFHPTQTAAWGDFNRDGWLDLFIGNESKRATPHASELYFNNGDGTFSNIAASTGLNLEVFAKGSAWGDFNNDGLPDLYISVLGGPNHLFQNMGGTSPQDWKFQDVAAQAGVQEPKFSFPTWFFDYNNDGWEDIFVSGYDARRLENAAEDAAAEFLGLPATAETMRLFRNNGDGTFTNVTKETGLDKVAYSMGCNFGDLDNDGWLDFYLGTGAPDYRSLVPNRMFRNVNGQRFEEVTMNGFAHIQKGHGIAFGDLDRDGDQDIYCVMGGAFQGDAAQNVLFENPGFGRSWITLLLDGKPANRSAIGARIKVEGKDASGAMRSVFRTVGTGGSFGANSLQEEIGLGETVSITSLEISWPGGNRDTFKDVPINTHIRISEGEKSFRTENRPPAPFKASGGHAHHH